jgi:hypothetical protein
VAHTSATLERLSTNLIRCLTTEAFGAGNGRRSTRSGPSQNTQAPVQVMNVERSKVDLPRCKCGFGDDCR